MPKIYLPGVYLYGGLTLLMLFAAHFNAGNKWGVACIIIAAGVSYLSSVAGVLELIDLADFSARVAVVFGLLSFLLFLF